MTAHRSLTDLTVRRSHHGFAVESPELYCWDEDPEEVIQTAEAVHSAAVSGHEREITYTLDSHDRIVELGGAWTEFAHRNDAPELTAESVIGRQIWNFIVGRETLRLYEDAMRQVRQRGKQVAIPARCDSPTHARWIQVTLSPGAQGQVRQRSVIVHEAYRVYAPLLDRSVPRSDLTLAICSFCNDCHIDSRWTGLESLLDRLDWQSEAMPRLQRTVCPRCTRRVHGEIQRAPCVRSKSASA
jgi:hypothetical protein